MLLLLGGHAADGRFMLLMGGSCCCCCCHAVGAAGLMLLGGGLLLLLLRGWVMLSCCCHGTLWNQYGADMLMMTEGTVPAKKTRPTPPLMICLAPATQTVLMGPCHPSTENRHTRTEVEAPSVV